MNRRQFAASVGAVSAACLLPVLPALGRAPIRSSCDKDDPGYEFFMRNGGHGERWRIYLDGRETDKVITADEGQGFVYKLRVNDQGHTFLDPDDPTRPATETLHGSIRIVVEPHDHPVISA